jgi:hypothetical protein
MAESVSDLSTAMVLGGILAIVAPMAVIGGMFMAVGRFREQLSQVQEALKKLEAVESAARQEAAKRIASLERWRERVRGREEVTGVHSMPVREESGEH